MKTKRQKRLEALARWEIRLKAVAKPAANAKGDLTQKAWLAKQKIAEDQIARLKEILGGGG